MGGRRKRRKLILKPKPKIPKMFECPRCGRVMVTVKIKDGVAEVKCGSCGLSDRFPVPPIYDEANAYATFLDRYLSGQVGETEEAEQKETKAEEGSSTDETEGENGGLSEEFE
mgnify:CR=1 FL=1